ncbi:1077_t:CDS:2 [Entrophospora sp. SA101]|nr:12109_t:CDS:2 [Entrophospora sp. SA101]CAJ0761859.1 1077_t:CDS:2 [Entrophospora sp. SA101]CAJ0839683.1 3963_t:CDS:2 [Entrophospora sp. SA101]CAJ0873498.1 18135_t:CDS:2 [Entrophospora sp. SA101]
MTRLREIEQEKLKPASSKEKQEARIINCHYTDFKTEIGTLRERKFELSATEQFIKSYEGIPFAKEQALPNLYRQASLYFGND